jgi:hypothetical protein
LVALIGGSLLAAPTATAGVPECEPRTWGIEPSTDVGSEGDEFRGVTGVAEDDVWAVGTFQRRTGQSAPLIQHWDGVGWTRTAVPDDLVGSLDEADASATDDVWAVGSRITDVQASRAVAFHWEGAGWTRATVGKPEPGSLVSTVFTDVVAIAPGDAWAVGRWSSVPDAEPSPLIEHWDGETWTVAEAPVFDRWTQLRSVAASGPNDVWAVGDTEVLVGDILVQRAIFEHWNGRRWTVVASPLAARKLPYTLESVDARTRSDAWATGQLTHRTWTETISFHWDGDAWTEVPTPAPSDSLQLLTSVAIVGRDRVWAGGG